MRIQDNVIMLFTFLYRGCNVFWFCGHSFSQFSPINFACINVAICDLVHDVETDFYLCLLLTASENLF